MQVENNNHIDADQKVDSAGQKSNPPRRSVARTVTISLAVMVVALVGLSALALFGFFSFSNALNDISDNTIPKIIQGSQVASLGEQLLYETERLSKAKSHPERRIAYLSTIERFDQIESRIKENNGFNSSKLQRDLSVLKSTLIELNELVQKRIEVTRKFNNILEALLLFEKELIEFDQKIRIQRLDEPTLYLFSSWVSKSIEIINIGTNTNSLGILYKVKRTEKQIWNKFYQLELISESFPEELAEEAGLLEARLGYILLGDRGVLNLITEQIKISRKSAGRGNFTSSLVLEFKSANVTLFNEVISSVSESTQQLSTQVRDMAWLLVIVSFSAMIAAIFVVYFFRRNLLSRLLALNTAILGKMEGEDVVIEERGNDEIADMAKSFKYFSAEVDARERKLIELATIDALTGINNRRCFMESGAKELVRARRFGYPVTLLMMDLDHFKTINDTLGHHCGDVVLQNVASLCLEILREIDIFGRIGGEEFAVLLPDADFEEGKLVAERVREAIESSTWQIDDEAVSCTISIGIAQSGIDDVSLGDLMKKSDSALYIAKQRGRNQCYGIARED